MSIPQYVSNQHLLDTKVAIEALVETYQNLLIKQKLDKLTITQINKIRREQYSCPLCECAISYRFFHPTSIWKCDSCPWVWFTEFNCMGYFTTPLEERLTRLENWLNQINLELGERALS